MSLLPQLDSKCVRGWRTHLQSSVALVHVQASCSVAGEYTMRPQIEVKQVRAGTPEALWRERILQWAESGLAQVEFCREHGLSLDEFRRYRTRLSRPAKAAPRPTRKPCTPVRPAFVEVTVSEPTEPEVPALVVQLTNGRSISVRPGFHRATLVALVAVLEGLPC